MAAQAGSWSRMWVRWASMAWEVGRAVGSACQQAWMRSSQPGGHVEGAGRAGRSPLAVTAADSSILWGMRTQAGKGARLRRAGEVRKCLEGQ